MLELYKKFLTARYLAEELQAASILESHSEAGVKHHMQHAHRHFRELADLMGYDVTKRESA